MILVEEDLSPGLTPLCSTADYIQKPGDALNISTFEDLARVQMPWSGTRVQLEWPSTDSQFEAVEDPFCPSLNSGLQRIPFARN